MISPVESPDGKISDKQDGDNFTNYIGQEKTLTNQKKEIRTLKIAQSQSQSSIKTTPN